MGVDVSTVVSFPEKIDFVYIIVALHALNFIEFKNGEQASCEEKSRSHWGHSEEPETGIVLDVSTLAAEEKEGANDEKNKNNCQVDDIVDKAEVVESHREDLRRILTRKLFSIALKLPANGGSEPYLLHVEITGCLRALHPGNFPPVEGRPLDSVS